MSSEPTRRLPRIIAGVDTLANWLYGSRYNPLYQSGTIVAVLLLVLLVTGVWLLLFYRIAAPWESVARVTADPWLGGWVRGLHRYASAGALLAAAWHAVRMFLQRRSWGPRTLAWLSGVALLGLLFACGWTGYVMVWDRFGAELAAEGARVLDALPILSEPLRRAFISDQPVPGVFFFMNLFLHAGLPLGLGIGLWLHVSRLARPALLPPRGLWVAIVLLFTVVSIAWPPPMDPAADPASLPRAMSADWLYAFWLPIHRTLPPWGAWLAAGSLVALLVAVPRLTKPPKDKRPEPSHVDSRLCNGCRQCALDCPFEAITMVARAHGPGELVAKVDQDRCVSCGICAGSCDVVAIGPPGRSGSDQLQAIQSAVAAGDLGGKVAVLGCRYGIGEPTANADRTDWLFYSLDCAGSLHRSVVEDLLERGARGITIVTCNARDCWHREGPKWLGARVAGQREPALRPSGDPRVRVLAFGRGEDRRLVEALRQFEADLG